MEGGFTYKILLWTACSGRTLTAGTYGYCLDSRHGSPPLCLPGHVRGRLYPALGLPMSSTLGFFFLGHLLDVILIATQVVGPADHSHYIISYFGPAVNISTTDDDTQRRPQSDWS